MTKSITTVWLIALLTGLMSMCAATVQAQNPTSGTAGPLTWKYDTDMRILTISGKGEIPNYDWEHPAPWSDYYREMRMLVIEEGITGIGREAFQSSWALDSVTLPKSLTRIGMSSFSDCTKLTVVTIPNGVKRIGIAAFNRCKKLSLVTLPAGLQEIDNSAFGGCENLSMVVFPDGMIRIGIYAFGYCSSLSFVMLPASVIEIGSGAFSECKNLKNFTINIKTPPAIDKNIYGIEQNVFEGVSLANVTLTVPKGSKAAYAAAPVWKEFKQIGESTVANVALPEARIYAAGGRLYLTLQTAAPVGVYTLNGVLVRTFSAPAGETTVALPQGVYIVRVGERTEKVFIN